MNEHIEVNMKSIIEAVNTFSPPLAYFPPMDDETAAEIERLYQSRDLLAVQKKILEHLTITHPARTDPGPDA